MNTDASFVLQRCGRQASRSPALSITRMSPTGARRSGTHAHGAPLLYCELDWQPSIAASTGITTWADTSSLRLSEPKRPASQVRHRGGAGWPRP